MLAGADHPDPVAAVSRRRDGVERPAVHARLDVEGEHPQRGHEVGGLEARIPVDASDAGAPLERPVDAERAPDPLVDQEAVREADVGLEALDAGVGQAGP